MGGQSGSREVRNFGVLVGTIFLGIATWPILVRGEGVRGWALVVGGALVILGLALPKSLEPVYRAWMWVGHTLGTFNTRLLLGLIYFLVMTPTGMIMRLVGRDPLNRQLRDADSYWVPHRRPRDVKSAMERMF